MNIAFEFSNIAFNYKDCFLFTHEWRNSRKSLHIERISYFHRYSLFDDDSNRYFLKFFDFASTVNRSRFVVAEWSLKREMKRQSLPFSHTGWKIEKKNFPSHMKKGNLKKIFSLFSRNVRFCLFFMDNYSIFFHVKRKIKKISFLFIWEMRNWKKKFLFHHVKREIEKNLFYSHAKCGIPHFFPFPRDYAA